MFRTSRAFALSCALLPGLLPAVKAAGGGVSVYPHKDVRASLICEGVDDTAALAAALAAVTSGGSVILPNTICVTNSVLTVAYSKVTIQGGGNSSVIQAKTNANLQNVLKVNTGVSDFKLLDVIIDGNRSNLGTSQNSQSNDYSCVSLHGSHIILTNVEIRLCQATGIYFGDHPRTTPLGLRMDASWVHDNGGTIDSGGWGTGIYLDEVSDITISGNRFENNYNTITGPGPSGAINTNTANNVVVSNNYVLNNYNVLGGQIVTGFQGKTCATSSQGWSVSNNQIIRTSSFSDVTGGVEVCGVQIEVGANTITNENMAGVALDPGSAFITVSGNSVYGSYSIVSVYGISSAMAHDVALTGNTGSSNTIGVSIGYSTIYDVNVTGNNLAGATTPLLNSSTTATISISGNLGVPDNAASGNVSLTSGASIPVTGCAGPSSSSLAVYVDTRNGDEWSCDATNSWKRVLSVTGAGPREITGTAGAPSAFAAGRVPCYFDSTLNTQACLDSRATRGRE
jgi:hypothetical protein